MALLAYALTTVNKLRSYMGSTVASEELLSVYHDGTGGVTSATVQVTATQITAIDNISGTTNLVFTANTTIDAMVTAINAISSGWQAAAVGAAGDAASSGLDARASVDALLVANQQFLAGENDALFVDAINAATEEIEEWTSRRFASTVYNQLFNGTGRRRLNVRQYPIIDVARVSVGRRDAFRIINNSTDNADAIVSLDGLNLTLEIVGGADAGTDTVSYTGATQIGAFITSINAIGKQWVATIETDADATWLVDDLFQFEGRNARRNELSMRMPDQSVRSFDVDAAIGQLVRTNVGRSTELLGPQFLRHGGNAATPWELRPFTAESGGPFWPEGVFNVYVRYTAGFATIPADLEMMANRVAAGHIRMGKRDQTLQSESVSGYSYTRATDDMPLNDSIKQSLTKYKRMWASAVAEV